MIMRKISDTVNHAEELTKTKKSKFIQFRGIVQSKKANKTAEIHELKDIHEIIRSLN